MDYRKFKELESKIHAHLSALTEDNGKIYDHCCKYSVDFSEGAEDNGKIYDHCCKYSVDFSEGEICARIGDIVITVKGQESRFILNVSASLTYDKELALLENFEALIPVKILSIVEYIKVITEEVNQR